MVLKSIESGEQYEGDELENPASLSSASRYVDSRGTSLSFARERLISEDSTYYYTITLPPRASCDSNKLPVARIPRRRRSSSFFHQSSMRRQSENFRRSSFGHHSTVLDRYTPLHSKLPPSVHKYVYRIRPTIVLGDESLSKAHYEYEFRPFFVAAVIVLNIFMFIITMFVANWDFLSFHGNPMVGPSSAVLIKMGAKDAHAILSGQWWRLFTAMFLHAGIIHLFLNMIVLYRLGWGMEQSFGAHRVAPIYLLSGLSATVSSCIFLPSTAGVGASGAMYGLLGAMYGDLILHWHAITDKFRYVACVTLSTIFGIVIGLYPSIDNFAHLAGFICGFFASLFFLAGVEKDEKGRSMRFKFNLAMRIVGAVFLVFWFTSAFTIFYTIDPNENWCPVCRHLNCVQTPWWDCCIPVQTESGVACMTTGA